MTEFITFLALAAAILVIYRAAKTMQKTNKDPAHQPREDRIEPISVNKNNDKKSNINWEVIPTEFVIFDLETTGLKTNKIPVDIIEISAIRVQKSRYLKEGTIDTFSTLVHPWRGGLNREATLVNGITQEMLEKEAVSMDDALPQFVEFVGNRLLVAYNVDFDRWFLQRELSDKGFSRRFKYECALQLARSAFPFLDNHRLETVAKHLGLDTRKAHRGLEDCRLACEAYLAAKTILSATEPGGERSPQSRFNIRPVPEYTGKVVVFTGTLQNFYRDEAEEHARRIGMTVRKSVSKNTDYLIKGDLPGGSLSKAEELGVKILTEQDFLSILIDGKSDF